jgi:Ca2+-binding EF-hand superfamily protein
MNIKKRSLLLVCILSAAALPAAFAGGDKDKEFQMHDTDGNGKISRTEHAAVAKKLFAEADTDRDGFVTANEMAACMAKKHGDKAAHHGSAAGKPDKMISDIIQMSDQNGDGKLTMAEHDAGADKMFAKYDSDGDGALSKDECNAAKKEMKNK